MVAYWIHEQGCGSHGACRRITTGIAGSSPRSQRADVERTLRADGHDAAGGKQAPGDPGGGEPRRHRQERPGAGALPQPRPHQRHRRTVDRQIRARATESTQRSEAKPRKGRLMSSQYVYVTCIRTTPQKLWDALTSPEFQRKYWFDMYQESKWTKGSKWSMHFSDGRVADQGEVLESDPPRRLVLKWRNEFRPELKAEGFSRCVYEIEPDGDVTRLTVTHSSERENAEFIKAVAGGWPRILARLKSLLETGAALPRTHSAPQT